MNGCDALTSSQYHIDKKGDIHTKKVDWTTGEDFFFPSAVLFGGFEQSLNQRRASPAHSMTLLKCHVQ